MYAEEDLWNHVLDKAATLGLSGLSEVERTVYLVNSSLCDLDNGGLSGLLYNLSPDTPAEPDPWKKLREVGDAFGVVGAPAACALLQECAVILASVDDPRCATWGDFLEHALPQGFRTRLEALLRPAADAGWLALSAFTTQHEAALATGGQSRS